MRTNQRFCTLIFPVLHCMYVDSLRRLSENVDFVVFVH